MIIEHCKHISVKFEPKYKDFRLKMHLKVSPSKMAAIWFWPHRVKITTTWSPWRCVITRTQCQTSYNGHNPIKTRSYYILNNVYITGQTLCGGGGGGGGGGNRTVCVCVCGGGGGRGCLVWTTYPPNFSSLPPPPFFPIFFSGTPPKIPIFITPPPPPPPPPATDSLAPGPPTPPHKMYVYRVEWV